MSGVELMIVLVVLTVTCLYLFQQHDAGEKDVAGRRLAFEKKRVKVEREMEQREQACQRLSENVAEMKERIVKLEQELRDGGFKPPAGVQDEEM